MLLFQAGVVTTQTIQVPIVGDAVPEDAETFSVFLSNAEGAVLEKALGTAIVSDDDAAQTSLALSIQGAGGVSLDPPGGVYDPGTLVILTALPARGSVFAGWSGDLSGAENPATRCSSMGIAASGRASIRSPSRSSRCRRVRRRASLR